jgi:protein O-GlcNAc transferase
VLPSRFVLDDSSPATRSQYGLSDDKFVFCNFSQFHNITKEVFAVWMRILLRVPNSVLWLIKFPGPGSDNILSEV